MSSDLWSALPPEQVPGYLASMGLEQETLGRAITLGYDAAADCTGHDPSGLPGTLVWGKAIRSLRDDLAVAGWTARSARNLPTIVHPSRRFEITVAAGNAAVGRRTVVPRTRPKRGAATERAVSRNQLSLAGFDQPEVDDGVDQAWFLLHFYDTVAEEIRVELSLPATYEHGRVVAWHRRLILDPLPGGPGFPVVEEEPEAIEVEIKPRVG